MRVKNPIIAPASTDKATAPRPVISLIIPAKNEETNIRKVCEEATAVLDDCEGPNWEILVISDASTDETDAILAELSSRDPRIRGYRLHPGQGQSAAMEAGFRLARSPLLATMDGDGQNDPADLPRLLTAMRAAGVDMMCGIRAKRADNAVRRYVSRYANAIRAYMLDDNITDVGCSLRVFRRSAALRIPKFRNFHRFFPALFQMAGYTVGEIPVNHRPRMTGESKYGGGIRKRALVVIVDLAGVLWLRRRALRYKASRIGNIDG